MVSASIATAYWPTESIEERDRQPPKQLETWEYMCSKFDADINNSQAVCLKKQTTIEHLCHG